MVRSPLTRGMSEVSVMVWPDRLASKVMVSAPLPAVQSANVAALLLALVIASRRVQLPSKVVLSALVSTTSPGVFVGVWVGVGGPGVLVGVMVGVFVGVVGIGVWVGVLVGTSVGVWVGPLVGVSVGVAAAYWAVYVLGLADAAMLWLCAPPS